MASDGKEQEKGSGEYNLFWLDPVSEALSLDPEITVGDLRRNGSNPRFFGPGTQGTVFPLSKAEFAAVVRAIAKASPEQAEALTQWLQRAGYRGGTAVAD